MNMTSPSEGFSLSLTKIAGREFQQRCQPFFHGTTSNALGVFAWQKLLKILQTTQTVFVLNPNLPAPKGVLYRQPHTGPWDENIGGRWDKFRSWLEAETSQGYV